MSLNKSHFLNLVTHYKHFNTFNMETNEALYNYVLRIGDTSMIHAQRLAEWCSNGPILEEDLALTNMSLDMLGQAENFYDYAADLHKEDTTADQLAFRRDERHFYNYLIVEQPNGDFGFTMVKMFLYSSFAKRLFEKLVTSSDVNLQGLAEKSLKEIKYHYRHSHDWLVRLGNGTEESNRRIQYALNELWSFTDDMFQINETDKALMRDEVIDNVEYFYSDWLVEVKEVFNQSKISVPEKAHQVTGGINAIHTEHLGHVLCEMQYLQRAHPDAEW